LWLFNFYNQKNSLHKAGNPLECSRSKSLWLHERMTSVTG
jgi:hypothetical protein